MQKSHTSGSRSLRRSAPPLAIAIPHEYNLGSEAGNSDEVGREMRRGPCIVISGAPQDRGEHGRDGAGAKRVRHGGAGEGGCGEERQSAIAEGKERDHEKWQRASAHNVTSAEITGGWPPWCRLEGKSKVNLPNMSTF